MILAWLAGLLALVGALISIYFLLVAAGRMHPGASIVPRFCRMEQDTCSALLSTWQARVLGVSNAAVGLVWYLLLLAAIASRATAVPAAVWLAVAGLALLLSVYLTYQLLFVLRVRCPLCLAALAANAGIFVLVWLGALGRAG